MNKLEFWQQKMLLAFHDPPHKPFAILPGSGGHEKVARSLFDNLFEAQSDYGLYLKVADFAASGADRPVLEAERGHRRGIRAPRFNLPGMNCATHPLAPGAAVLLHNGHLPLPRKHQELRDLTEETSRVLTRLAVAAPPEWQDRGSLERLFYQLWRRYRDMLAGEARHSGPDSVAPGSEFWRYLPADTRCPDHSIWEHLRVASALAFLDPKAESPEREPWLFQFSLVPVQAFIRQARSSRDLWISSFLLSDLIWHAMLPVVEHYGPDAVVYPDLRGNPRADFWLKQAWPAALPDTMPDPATYAAVLPDSFTAILPRGGDSHLISLQELARKCQEGLEKRWSELSECVFQWLSQNLESTQAWEPIWRRQHRVPPIRGVWSAVAWKKPKPFSDIPRGGALPFQEGLPELDSESLVSARDRCERLSPWVTDEVWGAYEWTREVFFRSQPDFLRIERGYDYALTHHQLRVRHRLRKARLVLPPLADEQGEKCSVCRERQALVPDFDGAGLEADTAEIDGRRRQAREFWKGLDESGEGRERLCGVCAFKRYLIVACAYAPEGFNATWAGQNWLAELKSKSANVDGPRVPFPSTAALAAQAFLAGVATDSRLAAARLAVIEAHDAAMRQSGATRFRTAFASSLPCLAVAAGDAGDAFLELDTQTSVFPSAVLGQMERYRQDQEVHGAWERLHDSVKRLRQEAKEAGWESPGTRFAVLRLDGDKLGQLLLGDSQQVATRWRDVIHPDYLSSFSNNRTLREAGWETLLEAKRLMSPSLHAFISRTLAEFSHRLVPWVVEREFGGRLIYAGGDDILALAPAADALAIAARLQQLYSAAWIVDTRPRPDAWDWRKGKNGTVLEDPATARSRFAILKTPRAERLGLPFPAHSLVRGAGCDRDPNADAAGELLPMMGPGCSLSAAVVIAHYKTPMRALLQQAGELLDEVAKHRCGGASVGLSHWSRGGSKSSCGLRWSLGSPSPLAAFEAVLGVVEAFRRGTLAGRLPYKLRDLTAKLTREQVNGLEEGFLLQALDGETLPSQLREAVLSLWREGRRFSDPPVPGVDALLLCRSLAADADAEDEEA